MSLVAEQDILTILRKIVDVSTGRDIVDSGLVSKILIKEGHIKFALQVQVDQVKSAEKLRRQAQINLQQIPGVDSVTIALTAHQSSNKKKSVEKIPIPGVKSIVAVASGKGGVGKSTTAVNLALALRDQGLTVGLMDADIYGPSIPLMLGINTQPKGDGRNIYPLKRFDLQCISVGFFNNQGNPIVWRGPMVQKAIKQLLYKVLWKDIDILVIDLPPGTGDAHITLAVTVPLTGAVIVSTPQELALIDACKGLQMFRSVHVPVIGIIENMSSFSCPNCSHETAIFDQGSVKQKAKDLKTSFLGSVPLSLDLRKASDNGQPLINSDPNHKISKLYKNIAKKISAFICKKDLVQKKA